MDKTANGNSNQGAFNEEVWYFPVVAAPDPSWCRFLQINIAMCLHRNLG
jgi:hypothetical protein